VQSNSCTPSFSTTKGEGDMRKTRKTARIAALLGLLASAALVALTSVATTTAATQAAPANVDPPTITGTQQSARC